jgi:hypothetical protein
MKTSPKQKCTTKQTKNSSKKARGADQFTPEAEFTKEAIFLQPWFLPREVYSAVRRLLSYIHLMKMRYYFDDYGCLKCGKKENLYMSNGLCETCGVTIRHRMERSLTRRLRAAGVQTFLQEPPIGSNDDMMNAQQILSRRAGPI